MDFDQAADGVAARPLDSRPAKPPMHGVTDKHDAGEQAAQVRRVRDMRARNWGNEVFGRGSDA